MSKAAQKLVEELKHGQEVQQQPQQEVKSMGVMEALVEGLKEGVAAYATGLGVVIDAIPQELRHAGAHGAHELAAALFNGSGYVMYPRGSKDDPQQDQGHNVHGPQQEAAQPVQQEQQPQTWVEKIQAERGRQQEQEQGMSM